MYKNRQEKKEEKKIFPCHNDRNPDDQTSTLDPQRAFMFPALDPNSPPWEAVMRTHRTPLQPTWLRAFRVKKIQFFLGVFPVRNI